MFFRYFYLILPLLVASGGAQAQKNCLDVLSNYSSGKNNTTVDSLDGAKSYITLSDIDYEKEYRLPDYYEKDIITKEIIRATRQAGALGRYNPDDAFHEYSKAALQVVSRININSFNKVSERIKTVLSDFALLGRNFSTSTVFKPTDSSIDAGMALCCAKSEPRFYTVFINSILGAGNISSNHRNNFIAIYLDGVEGVIAIKKNRSNSRDSGENTVLAVQNIVDPITGKLMLAKGGLYSVPGKFRVPYIEKKASLTKHGFQVVTLKKDSVVKIEPIRFLSPVSENFIGKDGFTNLFIHDLMTREGFRSNWELLMSDIDSAVSLIEGLN